MMVLTDAQKRANQKYNRKTYKRVPLDLRKEYYDKVKSAADNVGESVNGYIKKAIDQRMESENN